MSRMKNQAPVFGFSGWSGSGKTTLIRKLIPELKEKARENGRPDFYIAVIKHDAHGICLTPVSNGRYADTEGKDSWKFREAGADCVLLCGPEGTYISCSKESMLMERFAVEYNREPGSGGGRNSEEAGSIFSESEEEVLVAAVQKMCSPDLILAEGYKNGRWSRIGVGRKKNEKGLTADPSCFLAVVTDDPKISEACERVRDTESGKIRETITSIPVFTPDQGRELAEFLWNRI